MKCPHCLAELPYRYRTSRICSSCHKAFALEPRENVLGLSDLRLRGIAERLSGKGTYRYTARQLAHAVAIKTLKLEEKKHSSLGSIIPILFIMLMLICPGLMLALLVDSIVCLIIPIFIAASTLLAYIDYLKKTLPKVYKEIEQFEVHYIEPWEFIHGLLPGRVAEKEIVALRQFHMPLSRVRAVVASFSEDVLDCLRANGLVEQLGLALLNPRQLTDFDRDVINLLRNRPRLPIFLIHDASLFGSLMATILRKEWELTPQHLIIDLGLHPRHVQRLRLPWRKLQPSRAWLQLFEWQASVPNGLKLTKAEQKWLRKGYETSVLFIPPARLIKVVTKAVERAALKRATVAVEQTVPKQMVDPETQAQTKARSVGFMTWPS